MSNLLLTADAAEELELLLQLAQKLGIAARVIPDEALEDLLLGQAIEGGKTDSFSNTDSFLKELRL